MPAKPPRRWSNSGRSCWPAARMSARPMPSGHAGVALALRDALAALRRRHPPQAALPAARRLRRAWRHARQHLRHAHDAGGAAARLGRVPPNGARSPCQGGRGAEPAAEGDPAGLPAAGTWSSRISTASSATVCSRSTRRRSVRGSGVNGQCGGRQGEGCAELLRGDALAVAEPGLEIGQGASGNRALLRARHARPSCPSAPRPAGTDRN